MKITDEVFQVGGAGFTDPQDAAVYLIHFEGEAAVVDAGCGGAQDRLFRNILDCGVGPHQIRDLLVTHCHYDHTGGINGFRDRTKCRVIVHEHDAQFLEAGDADVTAATWYGDSIDPIQVDHAWRGEQMELKLGGRAISALHTPGHSPGSAVYITESEGLKILFGQDVHGPLDASLLSDREDYLRSLRKLLTLEADILCEGHYGVIKGKGEVSKFIESFL